MAQRGRKSARAREIEALTPKPETAKSGGLSIAPPRRLGEQGMALWRSITADYAVTTPDATELLAQACLALDRAESCRDRIDRDGEAIVTDSGIRDHPLLKHELGARAFVSRVLIRMGLEDSNAR